MLRLSASKLDSFRLYRDQDWMPIEKLVSDLSGTGFEITDAIRLGRAFHRVIEKPLVYAEYLNGAPVYSITQNGVPFVFDEASVNKAVVDITGSKSFVHEMKTTDYVLDTSRGPVRLVSKCDGIDGLDLFEFKTREKAFDIPGYLDALQWRAYLLAFECQSITYRLCRLRQDRPGIWHVVETHSLALYPYRGMEGDVRATVESCVDFMIAHCPDALSDDVSRFYRNQEAAA